MMKNRFFPLLLALVWTAVSLSSCKTEYEKIRESGDTDLMYKKALEYYDNEEYYRAQALFELALGAFRGKPELEDLYFKYAYTYYYTGDYLLASYYFKNFAQTFPVSSKREEAEYMSAYSNYRLSPSYRLDQKYTLQAIEEFQRFINNHPDSDRLPQCNKLIDELRLKLEQKAFANAMLYFDLKQYQAATLSFENLLIDFPDTDRAEEIRYLIVKAAYLLAINSVPEKIEERLQTARGNAAEFLEKYGKSAYANDVKAFQAEITQKLKSLRNDRYQEKSSGTGS